jgi:dihydrofolate reductase
MKNISIIVVVANNFAIGKNNDLLCHLPADLKRFKQITSGNTVIMGKRTFESLPKGALPNRTNIVISDNKNDEFEGCTTVYSIEEAIEKCYSEKENFIIGGGSIYRQFLQYANKLYITKIHHSFDADTFFPEIDFNQWTEISCENNPPDKKNKYNFTFFVYHRKKALQ